MITASTSTVRITADTSEFQRAVQAAEARAQMLDTGFGKLRMAAVAMAGAMVSAAGIGGMGAMVMRSMQLQDELAKTADRLGISTQTLKAFQLQADLAGIGADGFDRAIEKMTLNLQDAAKGTGTAKDAIKELGLNIFELASKSPDQAYFEIANAMNALESETQKMSIAADIFGVKSTAMVNMINEGRDGFDAAARKTEEFGTALSRVDAAKLEAANDSITIMKESVDGLATRIGVRLAPLLQQMSENFAHNSVALARFFGFTTEQEHLNELLAKRADIMNRIHELEENAGGETGHSRMLRNNANLLRDEINVILNKQQAEAQAAVTADRLRVAEEKATQQRLEIAAREKEAEKNLKASRGEEYETYMRNMEARRELNAALLEEETLNAEASQASLDMRVAGYNNFLENIKQINALLVEDERNKNEIISTEQQAELDAQIQRGESAFSTMLGNVASHNKTFFKIQKIYRLSKLAMEAPAAIADSYAWGTSWGGPPAGAAMATIAGAAMATYAGQLMSANYGGGGGASAGSGGGANINTNPVTAQPQAGATTMFPSNQREGSINIYIQGLANETVVREMIVPIIQNDIENHDLVIISDSSRQGQNLRNV